jgi:drug/metabolite transporter (DMT)-like permease
MLRKKYLAIIPYFELCGAMLLTAGHVVLGKIVIRSFPLFFASGSTMGLAAVIYFLILLGKGKVRSTLSRLTGRDIGILLLQAFTGLFLFRIFILVGVTYTGAIEAGIILSTTPAVTGFISFAAMGEKARWNKIIAIVLSVAGILVINLSKEADLTIRGTSNLLGSAVLFGAVIGDALFIVFRKILSRRITALENSSIISTFCFLMFVPLIVSDLGRLDVTHLVLADWLILILYGCVGPVLAFLLWFSGINRVAISVAGVFTSFLPLFTILLALIILQERIVWVQLAGMIIIAVGIMLSVRRSRTRDHGSGVQQSL